MALYSHLFEDGSRLELKEHLHIVGRESATLISSKKLAFSIPKNIIEEIAYIVGVCHDFGKATSFFQKDRLIKGAKNEKTSHSKLSAFWSYIVIKKYLAELNVLENWKLFLRSVVPYIIERHHSLLEDLEQTKNIDPVFMQYLKGNLEPEIFEYLFQYRNLTISFASLEVEFQDLREISNSLKKDYRELVRLNRREIEEAKLERAILFLLLFSVLMEADKARLILEEGEYQKEAAAMLLDTNIVDIYKQKEFPHSCKEGINSLREDAYQDVTQKVNQVDLDKFIYSLNLPTGLGKTLTSLSFALKLLQRLGENYKLIYSLPFLGIIEQTDEVLHEVFEEYFKRYGHSLLLKHHSLSELKYKSPAFDKEDIDKSEFLINIWNSKIVLTTFDQILYSIFSRNRSFIMRFHNLFNSIVIFDEIQSIPHKLWLLLAEFFKTISKVGNTYFILMTATKPLIFDKGEIRELVSDVPHYFKQLDRVVLHPRIDDKLILEDFFKEVVKPIIEANPAKDIMIVMNTINSSLVTYDFVKDLLKNANIQRNLIYLSTNIIPKDRIERIEQIRKKKYKNDLPNIIVTTQCVEAGVDIDADIILRDFAPMDCINQVCGRANRHALKENGEVWIYKLKDEGSGKYFSDYIYDSVLLGCTEELLKGKEQINESEFLKLNNEYFLKVKDRIASNEARAIIDNLCMIRFSEIDIRKLLRGDEDFIKIDLFVNKDEKSEKILADYKEALQLKDWKERKRRLLNLRKDFFENTISVQRRVRRKGQIYYPEELSDQIENNGYYIGKEYYNKKIGFDPSRTKKQTTSIF